MAPSCRRRPIRASAGVGVDPRPADAGRLVDRSRHQMAGAAAARFRTRRRCEHARRERAQDRVLLLRALERAGLLPAGVDPAEPPRRAFRRADRGRRTAISPTTPGDTCSWCSSRTRSARRSSRTCPAPTSIPTGAASSGDAGGVWRTSLWCGGSPRRWRRRDEIGRGSAWRRRRFPRATYRLQFHKDFGFDDARRDRALPRRARA